MIKEICNMITSVDKFNGPLMMIIAIMGPYDQIIKTFGESKIVKFFGAIMTILGLGVTIPIGIILMIMTFIFGK